MPDAVASFGATAEDKTFSVKYSLETRSAVALLIVGSLEGLCQPAEDGCAYTAGVCKDQSRRKTDDPLLEESAMKREVENIAASIQARLRNKAEESGRPFNEILQYYGMERFLHRLSKTPHADDFILKGGLMFYGLGIPMRRITRDIDFLGTAENMQNDMGVFQMS